jgi:hypothetical protein
MRLPQSRLRLLMIKEPPGTLRTLAQGTDGPGRHAILVGVLFVWYRVVD